MVCLDVPATGDALARIANDLAGTAYQLDITGPDAPARLAEHLEARHDGIDIVVHNAGITRDKTLAKMSPEQWEQVLDVNLVSQERINAELLAGNLIPVGGRIIAVASVTGIAGNRGQANYAASKAGVIGLVESMAGELASRGIAINAVAPGFIETEMIEGIPEKVRQKLLDQIPLKRFGRVEEVARSVVYICSADGDYITGAELSINGGLLM